MSSPRPHQRGDSLDSASAPQTFSPARDAAASYDAGVPYAGPNPTYASFSPATLSSATPSTTSAAKRRSTILVHQKSPLLLATPPQITRALAYSHPFLLPLNKAAGLLTWSTGDAWESFLVVAAFWAVVLYGGTAVRFAGPVVLVLLLIAGMYGRRFSPLSSSGWSEPGDLATGAAPPGRQTRGKAKGNTRGADPAASSGASAPATGAAGAGAAGGHQRTVSSMSAELTSTRHQKTLDEIVQTLKEFTGRCNILLEPLLELTDFLSTQRTPTSATTRPALTTLLIRILLCTPFWVALTMPPWRIITTRRVILVFGTAVLTWHARVAKAGRAILWRSATVRKLAALVTGLEIQVPTSATGSPPSYAATDAGGKAVPGTAKTSRESELTKAIRRARGAHDAGVRFTFIIYENQRRWVGLGWTNSLFAYERPAWTDEHNNGVPPRDEFELPEVEDGSRMRWRWVEGSRWKVDGVPDDAARRVTRDDAGVEKEEWDYEGEGGKMGWVYYDNKWQNGRRGQDGWGRWTRRRKWYRDAELVESEDNEEDGEALAADDAEKGTTPAPSLPPRPPSPAAEASAVPYNKTESMSMPDLAEDPAAAEQKDDVDGASLLSTSSRSTRLKSPSLRRRVTDTKHQRSRRASEARSEDDAASLGPRVGLEIQKERDQWGIGDEARMGLE